MAKKSLRPKARRQDNASKIVKSEPSAREKEVEYGIVRSNWKLIYDEWKENYLLYNLTSDPAEKIDLAAAQPGVLKDLARRLHAWRKLQIDYYTDTSRQTREYPPILQD
jgi:arylsulfatase A-like enzyme